MGESTLVVCGQPPITVDGLLASLMSRCGVTTFQTFLGRVSGEVIRHVSLFPSWKNSKCF